MKNYFLLALIVFFAVVAKPEVTTVDKVIGIGGSGEAIESFTFNLSGASDTDITYSATDIEFTNGSAKLKGQYASDVVVAATFASSVNLSYSRDNGLLTGTVTGTITATGGQLDLTGASGAFKKVAYSPFKNLPGYGIGAIKFKVTPSYSGAPATKQFFFTTSRTASGSNNFITIAHIANGDLYLEVTDYLNIALFSAGSAWSPTSGQQYEFEANFDDTNGGHRLFIDGVQHVGTSSGTGTLNHMSDYWHIGADTASTATDYAHFKIDDFLMFDAVQHTAGYTPGYSVSATKYKTTNPSFKNTTQFTASAYVSFSAGTTVSGSDLVKYQIEVGGQAKYWNGSAWANSDGTYAQSSTAAEIASNVDDLSAGATRIIAVLHSADGSTTPAFSYASLVYQ